MERLGALPSPACEILLGVSCDDNLVVQSPIQALQTKAKLDRARAAVRHADGAAASNSDVERRIRLINAEL